MVSIVFGRRHNILLHDAGKKYLLQQSSVSVLPYAVAILTIRKSICTPVFQITGNTTNKNLMIKSNRIKSGVFTSVCAAFKDTLAKPMKATTTISYKIQNTRSNKEMWT